MHNCWKIGVLETILSWGFTSFVLLHILSQNLVTTQQTSHSFCGQFGSGLVEWSGSEVSRGCSKGVSWGYSHLKAWLELDTLLPDRWLAHLAVGRRPLHGGLSFLAHGRVHMVNKSHLMIWHLASPRMNNVMGGRGGQGRGQGKAGRGGGEETSLLFMT